MLPSVVLEPQKIFSFIYHYFGIFSCILLYCSFLRLDSNSLIWKVREVYLSCFLMDLLMLKVVIAQGLMT